jgi:preprotein translocase subunit SecY
MQKFFRKLTLVFTEPAIRNRVLFILGALVIFRMLASIPIPGVDQAVLATVLCEQSIPRSYSTSFLVVDWLIYRS